MMKEKLLNLIKKNQLHKSTDEIISGIGSLISKFEDLSKKVTDNRVKEVLNDANRAYLIAQGYTEYNSFDLANNLGVKSKEVKKLVEELIVEDKIEKITESEITFIKLKDEVITKLTFNTSDWNKNLESTDFYKIQFNNYEGWDKTNDNKPYYISFSIVKGKDKSSKDMAIKFDDVAKGYFYYRDWTKSGLPFVDDGKEYNTGFWFQFKEDKKMFEKMFLKK